MIDHLSEGGHSVKKIFAVLLVAVFSLMLLSACGDQSETKEKSTSSASGASSAATEKATEADTEEASEAVTEEATEAPATEDATFTYTDPAGKYQLTVPAIWNETGLIKSETDVDGNEFVRFYYKAAYDQGAGHVFSIGLVEDASKMVDVTQLPHAEEIFNDGSRQVFVIYPTDVQFAPNSVQGTDEFTKQQNEYSALSETKESIIASFAFI